MNEEDCARMWAWEYDKHRQDVRGAFNIGFVTGALVTVILWGLFW